MSSNVFTYGSLMFAPVWQRVVRGGYRSAAARLDGYARFEIAGETYPGMIARPGAGASVNGVLYFDVAPADLAALDAFEGAEYRRDSVRVTLAAGETADAETYVYLHPQNLSESPWHPEAFQMARFIASYCRERLEEPERGGQGGGPEPV